MTADKYGPVWPAGALYLDLTPAQRAAARRRAIARVRRDLTRMKQDIEQSAASVRHLVEVLADPDETCASCGHRIADGCPCPHTCLTESEVAAELAAEDAAGAG